MARENFYPDDYYDEFPDEFMYDSCPKCGREYNDTEYEYQYCSHCKYDAENKKFLSE